MDNSYVAGFFDGEGCINPWQGSVRVTISQKYKPILEEIHNHFGFGTLKAHGTLLKGKWSGTWILLVLRDKYEQLLKQALEERSVIFPEEEQNGRVNLQSV